MGVQVVEVLGHSFNVVEDHYAGYWSQLSQLDWEPETIRAIAEFVRPGWQYFDIGAWMGPTVLLAAALGGDCYAFEPDPVAYGRLTANIEQNPGFTERIKTIAAAASVDEQPLTLFADARGNSETSVFSKRQRVDGLHEAPDSFQVPSVDLLAFLEKTIDPQRPVFIKVDVEGAEFALMPRIAPLLQTHSKAVLHLSTHPFNLVNHDKKEELAARNEAKRAIVEATSSLYWRGGSAAKDRCLADTDQGDELLLATFPV